MEYLVYLSIVLVLMASIYVVDRVCTHNYGACGEYLYQSSGI